MGGRWKVGCSEKGQGESGSASGEFSRLDDAINFARFWMRPGWTATITNPRGVQVEFEKGETPEFPGT